MNIFRTAARKLQLSNGILHRQVHTPRRALMYVPGDDKRKLRKANQLEADCIALDLEDAVAMNKKVSLTPFPRWEKERYDNV